MATMLIPGHDRDALQLLVSFTPDDLFDCGAPAVDEYDATPDDERVTALFLTLIYDENDLPDVVGLEDARVELDELAMMCEWLAAERDDAAAAA